MFNFYKKMRLDSLIIFTTEWKSNSLILGGKQSKYWSNYVDFLILKTKKMRLDPLIIFSIEWNSNSLSLGGKQWKY